MAKQNENSQEGKDAKAYADAFTFLYNSHSRNNNLTLNNTDVRYASMARNALDNDPMFKSLGKDAQDQLIDNAVRRAKNQYDPSLKVLQQYNNRFTSYTILS